MLVETSLSFWNRPCLGDMLFFGWYTGTPLKTNMTLENLMKISVFNVGKTSSFMVDFPASQATIYHVWGDRFSLSFRKPHYLNPWNQKRIQICPKGLHLKSYSQSYSSASGGISNMFLFSPRILGEDEPIWTSKCFSDELVQPPPTSSS